MGLRGRSVLTNSGEIGMMTYDIARNIMEEHNCSEPSRF